MSLVELSKMFAVEEDRLNKKPIIKLIASTLENKTPFGVGYDEEGAIDRVTLAVSLSTAKKLVTQLNKFIKNNKEKLK